MLDTIRKAIDNLPDKDFPEFYQEYITSIQDSIINHDISLAGSQFKEIEDVNSLIIGLNTMTEELKR